MFTKTTKGNHLSFLDTNIVQNLHTFGEFIFDGSCSPESQERLSKKCSCSKGKPCIQQDIRALREIILTWRDGWPLAVSEHIATELEEEPDPSKAFERLAWYSELAHYFDASRVGDVEQDLFTYLQREWLYQYLRVLPDKADRVLIVDALELGCGVFITMDYRTILRHREVISRLGIVPMRPYEYLAEMGFVLPKCQ